MQQKLYGDYVALKSEVYVNSEYIYHAGLKSSDERRKVILMSLYLEDYLFIYLLKTSLNTVTNQPVLKYLQIERLLFIRP